MVTLLPFAALRPTPEQAARICEPPYDVMSSDEARQIAADNPLSFLHVSKPEIDLPPGTDLHSPPVYARGKENFDRLIRDGALRQDAQPCFYLYRQVMGAHTQTGLVAAASCDEYLNGVIKKHELTRPDKEDDRVHHMEALNAQTGPVFLVHRAEKALDEFVARKTQEPPEVDFTALDGVQHIAWTVSSRKQIDYLRNLFLQVPNLYIADGHHRCAAAARVSKARRGRGQSSRFLSVVFPHNQVQIQPYNRVLKDLNGMQPGHLLQKLGAYFMVQPNGDGKPTRKHELGLFLDGKWHNLFFRHEFITTNILEQLDAALLQKHVLEPVFGIADPRTSDRIGFVGGIRGTAELEKLVRGGEYACAFSMFPTDIEDLMAVADADGLMPPKSTWFEPKLRDGMFSHLLG